ncbi:MAG TPA: uridine diphosphate-N-acetylglucosamine-binding protein YvcK [Mycobacteriales bacterium]|nr:uridine diphosphate-N-acetylglucosamine-binding protein YvcK [Mycobacteriales bacterium]
MSSSSPARSDDGGIATRRVVAFGGGHGLFASLRALRRLKLDESPDQILEITAVVTVADDGGSSGRIRREFDMLPPGDLRQALVALAGEDRVSATTATLFQHRFVGHGELGGHAVGNLLLAGLTEVTGSTAAALAQAGKILHTCGRVLPMSALPLQIEADVRGVDIDQPDTVSVVRGQTAVATTRGMVKQVRLVPAEPPASQEVLAAIANADWLIFGPGSWFTSVLPHFLVPELRDAIKASSASRLLILNLTGDIETIGLSTADLLHSLRHHAPEFRADVVLGDPSVTSDIKSDSDVTKGTEVDAALLSATETLGAQLVVAPIARDDGTARHAPAAFAAALRSIFDAG